MSSIIQIPLSIYIHLPWCVEKCPYCDFNSHSIRTSAFLEETYVEALLNDIDMQAEQAGSRRIESVFFGGGTPSLFHAASIGRIVEALSRRFSFSPDLEITLEANPGASDQSRFREYRALGINRLSIGVQSFQAPQLKILGRVHDEKAACDAINMAISAGFNRFNIDLMFGLPGQTVHDAVQDLKKASEFSPGHVSWYQLTLEPNTVFYKFPPMLPSEDIIDEMQKEGIAFLADQGLAQYEISAYSKTGQESRHNLNYWQFGDYLGMGAGAHGKISNTEGCSVLRTAHVKQPKDYLLYEKRMAMKKNPIAEKDLPFEFMLNALRLVEGVPVRFWEERTGLSLSFIRSKWNEAIAKGLMSADPERIQPTALGFRFLNDLTAMFLN